MSTPSILYPFYLPRELLIPILSYSIRPLFEPPPGGGEVVCGEVWIDGRLHLSWHLIGQRYSATLRLTEVKQYKYSFQLTIRLIILILSVVFTLMLRINLSPILKDP